MIGCVRVIVVVANPAASSRSRYSSAVSVPTGQPVACSAAARRSGSRPGSASTSLMPNRPPGRSTRAASARARGVAVDRVNTQLEMTTSTAASGSGIASRYPSRNSTLVTPDSAACAREVDHGRACVHADDQPVRPDPTSRQQHVQAAARAQVQHLIPGEQLRDRDRVTAGHVGPKRPLGHPELRRRARIDRAAATVELLPVRRVHRRTPGRRDPSQTGVARHHLTPRRPAARFALSISTHRCHHPYSVSSTRSGRAGADRPMTTSAAVGKHATHSSLTR